MVEYARFDYVDYVLSALANRFSLALTSKVTSTEYIRRILAMARAYEALAIALGIERDDLDVRRWRVLSFRSVVSEDEELLGAEAETGVKLQGAVYRVVFGRSREEPEEDRPSPNDHRKAWVNISETVVLFAGVLPQILAKRTDRSWQAIATS